MDRIRQSKRISASDDLILTGQVVWVGNSSLDVLMEIHRQKDIKEIKNHENSTSTENENESGAVLIQENVPSRLLSSLFTYVARDKQTGKACLINHFIPQGKDEENLFKKRETLAQSRKAAKRRASSDPTGSCKDTDTVGGNISAHNVLLSLVERGSAMEDMPALASFNSVLMRYTALENVLVCQPQNVNTAGRVFGGYLSKIFVIFFTPIILHTINLSCFFRPSFLLISFLFFSSFFIFFFHPFLFSSLFLYLSLLTLLHCFLYHAKSSANFFPPHQLLNVVIF